MSISKMYHKDVSYKEALDEVAAVKIAYPEMKLIMMAHTLAVVMGLVTALVYDDLKKVVNKLQKAA